MPNTIPYKKDGQDVCGIELFLSKGDYHYYEFNRETMKVEVANGEYTLVDGFYMLSLRSCVEVLVKNSREYIDHYYFPPLRNTAWYTLVRFSNGLLSATDKPAILQTDDNNRIEHWLLNGLPHREDGFAITGTNTKGMDGMDEYWLCGEKLTLQQMCVRQKDTIHASRLIARLLAGKDKDE